MLLAGVALKTSIPSNLIYNISEILVNSLV